tara:strand:+ start:1539 stop:2135 length:597 start_codon:yes stop_codon:yes gene_type:complete
MNIPFTKEQQPMFQTQMGNAGNGGQPNPPTIPNNPTGMRPRVNFSREFIIGGYNNNLESYVSPTTFNDSWKDNFYANNPIGIGKKFSSPGGGVGVAGDGGNQGGAGYTPNRWSPYDVSVLGVSGGTSQSFPYNDNDIYLDGGVRRVWSLQNNINEGAEQDVVNGEVDKMATVDEVADEVARLVREMGNTNTNVSSIKK